MDQYDDLAGQYDLMDLFEDYSVSEKWHRVLEGLKQPKDSGEYKWAKFQVLRLWAPVSGVAVPSLALVLALLLSNRVTPEAETVEVTVMEPEKTPEIEPIKEEQQQEPLDTPEYIENAPPSEVASQVTDPGAAPGPAGPPGPAGVDFSPQPAKFDSVAIVKSPLVFKGIYGSRNPGQIGSLTGKGKGGGGGGGGGSGTPFTEDAVLKALRWLKKYQSSDGTWDTSSGGSKADPAGPATPAMTGLALLTYLAHGETPTSEEFGPTVEKAIRWLVERQDSSGHFPNRDANDYSQPIATYALCEAFGMTQVPMVKDAAKKAVDVLIKGQHAVGGWNYHCDAADRNDISYSGWCAQALKAAKMAGLDNDGLDLALRKGVEGFKIHFDSGVGTFGYQDRKTQLSQYGLTAVGVLCEQLLGAGKSTEVQAAMAFLNKDATCDWFTPWGGCPIYYWYYLTQAKFHTGGDVWNQWNNQFSVQVTKNQVVLKGAGIDGKDIGYWEGLDNCSKAYVYNTTLCALMLEVYYRYLPTFKPPEDEKPAEDTGGQGSGVDVKVNI
jgi:hypothetical protein